MQQCSNKVAKLPRMRARRTSFIEIIPFDCTRVFHLSDSFMIHLCDSEV